MTDLETIKRLQSRTDEMSSKLSKQRHEISRLTDVVNQLTRDKAKMLGDIKWMRGES